MKKRQFASVWDAIEPTRSQAANMKARAEMMIAIRETVAAWGVTQAAAAKKLGLTQPRMNDLLRGRINKFSLDMLMNLATRAGLSVRLESRAPGGLSFYFAKPVSPGMLAQALAALVSPR